jgi:hypothetical protein
MPSIFHLIAIVFALVCFILAAWQATAPPDPTPNYRRLVAAGLAFLVASMIQW